MKVRIKYFGKEGVLPSAAYLNILKQINLGNKTATGISKAIGKPQSSVFEQLEYLKIVKIVKRDNKNWEIATKDITCGCCRRDLLNFRELDCLILASQEFIENKKNNPEYTEEKTILKKAIGKLAQNIYKVVS